MSELPPRWSVVSTSTRVPGVTKPATLTTGSTLTETARLAASITEGRPACEPTGRSVGSSTASPRATGGRRRVVEGARGHEVARPLDGVELQRDERRADGDVGAGHDHRHGGDARRRGLRGAALEQVPRGEGGRDPEEDR